MLAHNITVDLLHAAAGARFPIVVMDRLISGEGLINVVVDSEQGGYSATHYLIEKGIIPLLILAGLRTLMTMHCVIRGICVPCVRRD